MFFNVYNFKINAHIVDNEIIYNSINRIIIELFIYKILLSNYLFIKILLSDYLFINILLINLFIKYLLMFYNIL